jgi:tetratricopeptide (TPR) repeat protein
MPLLLAPVLLLSGNLSGTATNARRQVAEQTSQAPRHQPITDVASELRQAAELLQSGRLEQAESILRRLLVANPNNFDAHNLLGIVLDQRGRADEAEREYRSAIRLKPNGVSAQANLGVLLARTNRADEAIKMFAAVLRIAPDHPEATLNLGLQYSIRGDDARSLPLLQRAIELGVDTYDTRYRSGVSLYNLKRMDEASLAFEFALTRSAKPAEAYYYLGLIAWARGQDEQAADFWDRAVTLRPDFPEANFMLGEVLRKSRRTQAAVDFYKRALDQDPGKFVYYARLGGAYILLGQTDQAFEIFRRGVQRFPRLPEAHYFAGVAARARADYEMAETELRRSLGLEPDNVNGLAQLGFVLLERDRMAEAETALRRAIAINDKHFYANYDLGRLLVKSHHYDQALPILEHAAMIKPNNPSVHYQLFLALSRLKRKAEADRELATFKKLDEARKARAQSESDVEDDDLQNPSAPPAALPHPTVPRMHRRNKRMDDQPPIRAQPELRSSDGPESQSLGPKVLSAICRNSHL